MCVRERKNTSVSTCSNNNNESKRMRKRKLFLCFQRPRRNLLYTSLKINSQAGDGKRDAGVWKLETKDEHTAEITMIG